MLQSKKREKRLAFVDWNTLFTMQEKLDEYIEEKNNIKNTDVFREKCLALLVELGELANETRCFKFWSKKPRNDDSVILEEYVDNIHFLLSLGIEKGYRYTMIPEVRDTLSESEQFMHIFDACVQFKKEPTKNNYEHLFNQYLLLGNLLGYNETDIQEAYFKKNEVNYERQNQGY